MVTKFRRLPRRCGHCKAVLVCVVHGASHSPKPRLAPLPGKKSCRLLCRCRASAEPVRAAS